MRCRSILKPALAIKKQIRNYEAMDISLTPEQDEAAESLVKAGLFASKDDAVACSLDWLREEAEKLQSIRAAVELSAEQSARGESRPVTADEIMRDVRTQLEEEKTR